MIKLFILKNAKNTLIYHEDLNQASQTSWKKNLHSDTTEQVWHIIEQRLKNRTLH